jgi:hypothetical protein
MDEQECNKCGISLHISMFDRERNRKGEIVLRKQCSQCRLKQKQKRMELKKKEYLDNLVVVTEKVCTICENTKVITDFNKDSLSNDGHNSFCRDCLSEKRKKKDNLKDTTGIIVTYKICKICNKSKPVSTFKKAPRSKDGLFKTCNDCWKPKEWNNDKQKQSYKKYRQNHLEKFREKEKAPNNRIRSILRRRIRLALISQKTNKNNTTTKYLGCDIDFFKKWMEFQFNDEINWNTVDKWHIDHVKPCSSFDLTIETNQIECFSWKNLRPCLAEENMKKGDKIDMELITHHTEMVKKFLDTIPLPTQSGNSIEGAE